MSQLDAQTETIDGVTYEVRMLPATAGQMLLTRLLGLIGPAAGHLVGGDGFDEDIRGEAFGRAVAALFARATPKEVDEILKQLAEVTLADGKALKPIYDLHFAGRMLALGKWAAFALRAQYSDFLGGLAGALQSGGLAAAAAFVSQKGSTGASGA